jgi:hypothetical protein
MRAWSQGGVSALRNIEAPNPGSLNRLNHV